MTKNSVVIKADKLEHYQTREPVVFAQFDGWNHSTDLFEDTADEDGDELWSTTTYELMSGGPAVRVLITSGTSTDTALRLLEKLRDWVERGGLTDREPDVERMVDNLEAEVYRSPFGGWVKQEVTF